MDGSYKLPFGGRRIISKHSKPTRTAWHTDGEVNSSSKTPRSRGNQWQEFLDREGINPREPENRYDPNQPIRIRETRIVSGHQGPEKNQRVPRGDSRKWQTFLDDAVIIDDDDEDSKDPTNQKYANQISKQSASNDDNNNKPQPRSQIRLNSKCIDLTDDIPETQTKTGGKESLFLSKDNDGKEVWRINKIKQGSENVYKVVRANGLKDNDSAGFLMNLAHRFNQQMTMPKPASSSGPGDTKAGVSERCMNPFEGVNNQVDPFSFKFVQQNDEIDRVLPEQQPDLGRDLIRDLDRSLNLCPLSEATSKASIFQKLHQSQSGGTITMTPLVSEVDSRVPSRKTRGDLMKQKQLGNHDELIDIGSLDKQSSINQTKRQVAPPSFNPKSRLVNSTRGHSYSEHSRKEDAVSKHSSVAEDRSSNISIRLIDHVEVGNSCLRSETYACPSTTTNGGSGDTTVDSKPTKWDGTAIGRMHTDDYRTTREYMRDKRYDDTKLTSDDKRLDKNSADKTNSFNDSKMSQGDSMCTSQRDSCRSNSRRHTSRSSNSGRSNNNPVADSRSSKGHECSTFDNGHGDSKSQKERRASKPTNNSHVDFKSTKAPVDSRFTFRPISPELTAPKTGDDVDSWTTISATKPHSHPSKNTLSDRTASFKDPQTNSASSGSSARLENSNNNMALFDTPYEEHPRIKTAFKPSPTSCIYYSDSETDANVGRDVHRLRKRMSKKRHETSEAIKILSRLGYGRNVNFAKKDTETLDGNIGNSLGTGDNNSDIRSLDSNSRIPTADKYLAQLTTQPKPRVTRDSSNNNKNRKTTTVTRQRPSDGVTYRVESEPESPKINAPITFHQLQKMLQEVKEGPTNPTASRDINFNSINEAGFDILKNVDADSESSSPYIGQFLHKLWRTQCFCDVKVQVGDQCFLAHKLVLAAFSDVFYPTTPQPQPSVCFTIPNSTPEAVFQVFKYLYTSSMDLRDDLLEPVMAAAIFMGITEVQEVIKDILKSPTVENVAMYVNTQRTFGMTASITDYPHIIRENFMELAKSADFLMLGVEDMEKLLQDPDVLVDSEHDTIEVLSAWLEFNMHDRAMHIGRLLRYVNFEAISPSKIATLQEDFPHIFCTREGMEVISAAFKYHALKNIPGTETMWFQGDPPVRDPSQSRDNRSDKSRDKVSSKSRETRSNEDLETAFAPSKSDTRGFYSGRESFYTGSQHSLRDTFDGNEHRSQRSGLIQPRSSNRTLTFSPSSHMSHNPSHMSRNPSHMSRNPSHIQEDTDESSNRSPTSSDLIVRSVNNRKQIKSNQEGLNNKSQQSYDRKPHPTKDRKKEGHSRPKSNVGFRGNWKRLHSEDMSNVVQFVCNETSSNNSREQSPCRSDNSSRTFTKSPNKSATKRHVPKKTQRNSVISDKDRSPRRSRYGKETLI